MQRARVVDDAKDLYERFVEFALPLVDDERYRRFLTGAAARGREELRWAPREGETPAEVDELLRHWFEILTSWMSDPDAARRDPEALSFWIGEWPSGLMRNLLFVGLRYPDGLDQDVYKLSQLLPRGSTLRLEIGPRELNLSLYAPETEPIHLRRFAGTAEGMRLPLDLALGSLTHALLARERGEEA